MNDIGPHEKTMKYNKAKALASPKAVSLRTGPSKDWMISLTLCTFYGYEILRLRHSTDPGWRRKLFENIFFETGWHGNFLPDVDFIAATNSIKFSPKLEPSLRFFGRLKFSAVFGLVPKGREAQNPRYANGT